MPQVLCGSSGCLGADEGGYQCTDHNRSGLDGDFLRKSTDYIHKFAYAGIATSNHKKLLVIGNVPRGVFCEQSSQKTRESQREIMRMHDFCASRSVLLVIP